MDYNCEPVKTKSGPNKEMARNILSLLEKIKDIFGETSGTDFKSKICRFSGTRASPKTRRNTSNTGRGCDDYSPGTRPNGRSDRNAMRLLPGEVGLRGDRATFHLGPTAAAAEAAAKATAANGWRPTGRDRAAGAAYFRMGPDAAERRAAEKAAAEKRAAAILERQKSKAKKPRTYHSDADDANGYDHRGRDDGPEWQPKKHVVLDIPALPATRGAAVGPVTGLPVGDDEHVFVLWVDKRPGEPDEKARLQIEMRVPKVRSPATVSAGSQCDDEEPNGAEANGVKTAEEENTKNKKSNKKKAAGGKKKTAGKKKMA